MNLKSADGREFCFARARLNKALDEPRFARRAVRVEWIFTFCVRSRGSTAIHIPAIRSRDRPGKTGVLDRNVPGNDPRQGERSGMSPACFCPAHLFGDGAVRLAPSAGPPSLRASFPQLWRCQIFVNNGQVPIVDCRPWATPSGFASESRGTSCAGVTSRTPAT
jgi:hypothetical protein